MSRIARLIIIGCLSLGSLAASTTAAVASGAFYDQGPFDDRGTDTGVCGAYDLEYHDKGYFWLRNTTPELNGQFFYYSNVAKLHGVYTNPANGKQLIDDYTGTLRERNAKQLGSNPNYFVYESVELGVHSLRTGYGKVVYLSAGTLVRRWQFDSLGDSRPSGVRLAEPEVLKDTFKALDLCAVLHRVLG